MRSYADEKYDNIIVRNDIGRHPQFDTDGTRRAYARYRAEKLKTEVWSPKNETDRLSRISAYERYARGKL